MNGSLRAAVVLPTAEVRVGERARAAPGLVSFSGGYRRRTMGGARGAACRGVGGQRQWVFLLVARRKGNDGGARAHTHAPSTSVCSTLVPCLEPDATDARIRARSVRCSMPVLCNTHTHYSCTTCHYAHGTYDVIPLDITINIVHYCILTSPYSMRAIPLRHSRIRNQHV